MIYYIGFVGLIGGFGFNQAFHGAFTVRLPEMVKLKELEDEAISRFRDIGLRSVAILGISKLTQAEYNKLFPNGELYK